MRLEKAEKDDVIYCDPPYIGRYVDYYGGWTEESERRLFDLLSRRLPGSFFPRGITMISAVTRLSIRCGANFIS